jgi:hypothetical protein
MHLLKAEVEGDAWAKRNDDVEGYGTRKLV